MIGPDYTWRELASHWQLWRNGRAVAMVQPDAPGFRVVLIMAHPARPVIGRASSVASGRMYAERFVAAWVARNGPPL